MEAKNIYQRMHAAMKDIGSIKKDKKNTFQNYEYVSEEAIKTKCHKALVDHGIIFNLEVTEHDLQWIEGTNKQNQKTTTGVSNAKFRYHFTNIDNPEQKISGDFYAMSVDTSDKSFTKALTYAIREIMKSNFVISTGEPDPDSETPEVNSESEKEESAPKKSTFVGRTNSTEPASEKQIDLIKKMLGSRLSMFESAKGIKIDELNKAQASSIIEQLKAREEQSNVVKVADGEIDLNELPF